MQNKSFKPDHKPARPFQPAMCGKAYDLNGGRCRARTYDPVIKSHLTVAEIIVESFKLGCFVHSTDQWLRRVLQTDRRRQ